MSSLVMDLQAQACLVGWMDNKGKGFYLCPQMTAKAKELKNAHQL